MIYRYFEVSHALEALQTGCWKVGRINKLNDIFDCRPHIKNLPSDMAPSREEYLDILGGNLGLLCYSETIDDPVVWSHYAKSHSGIALGIVLDESNRDFYKVEYPKDKPPPRPELDFAELRKDPGLRTKSHRELVRQAFASKHPSWGYEQEYRQFVLLDACEMQGEHYFLRSGTIRVMEVVLGARCSVTMRDVYRIVSKNYPNPCPVVKQCKIDWSTYVFGFDTYADPTIR